MEQIQQGPLEPEAVRHVVEEIAGRYRPQRIYLYNQRYSAAGATTAFKLCVVAEFPDIAAAEREIYLEIDCEVPFDVLLYTPAEWEELCAKPSSFARKIQATGKVVYG